MKCSNRVVPGDCVRVRRWRVAGQVEPHGKIHRMPLSVLHVSAKRRVWMTNPVDQMNMSQENQPGHISGRKETKQQRCDPNMLVHSRIVPPQRARIEKDDQDK